MDSRRNGASLNCPPKSAEVFIASLFRQCPKKSRRSVDSIPRAPPPPPPPALAMSVWIDGESEIGYNAIPTFAVGGGGATDRGGGDTESLATIEDGLRVLDLVDADTPHGGPKSPHACAYCGIDDKSSVVQCVSSQKWFCNSKRNGLPASCAVYHLVRSRSNEGTCGPGFPKCDTPPVLPPTPVPVEDRSWRLLSTRCPIHIPIATTVVHTSSNTRPIHIPITLTVYSGHVTKN